MVVETCTGPAQLFPPLFPRRPLNHPLSIAKSMLSLTGCLSSPNCIPIAGPAIHPGENESVHSRRFILDMSRIRGTPRTGRTLFCPKETEQSNGLSPYKYGHTGDWLPQYTGHMVLPSRDFQREPGNVERIPG